jgi:hypothetical protein
MIGASEDKVVSVKDIGSVHLAYITPTGIRVVEVYNYVTRTENTSVLLERSTLQGKILGVETIPGCQLAHLQG